MRIRGLLIIMCFSIVANAQIKSNNVTNQKGDIINRDKNVNTTKQTVTNNKTTNSYVKNQVIGTNNGIVGDIYSQPHLSEEQLAFIFTEIDSFIKVYKMPPKHLGLMLHNGGDAAIYSQFYTEAIKRKFSIDASGTSVGNPFKGYSVDTIMGILNINVGSL